MARERAIFMAALDLDNTEAQGDLIARECGADDALKARVEALLHSHRAAGSFLEDQPAELYATENRVQVGGPEGPGTVVGPYKLLEPIGEGGFGVVFVAEQTQPVCRKVALKVLKPGMDTRQVIARFEAERQALAIMDHPNIAKVLDGGVTASGRPFFVMDLIDGVPITEYCDRNHLPARQRLELFISVCQAVQHAHQKGIIHRDLKPSNVLVTVHDAAPVVKVIDFGVSKALGQELTDKTLFTGLAQMIGTPLYMSPEQAGQSGLDVDSRSDIYSLGVLLYELLTGTTPFDKERFKKAAYDEIRRIIRDEEPLKPSSRLSEAKDTLASISAQRQIEPAKLTRLMRGDLDWIVMKALEKDRNRRYETANSFVQDLKHYLADEPVQARPPTAAYRFRKFVRRNKGFAIMAAVVGLACLVMVGSLGWIVRDRQSRRAAIHRELELSIDEARTGRERALASTGSPQDWDAALAEAASAFRRADVLAAQNQATLNSSMRQRLTAIRDQQAADATDRAFAARIDEIRLAVSETYVDGGEYARIKSEDAYPKLCAAFQTEFGVDVGVTPMTQAIELLQGRPQPIREILIDALAQCAGTVPKTEQRARDWLAAMLDAADTDPWQRLTRSAVAEHDWQGLNRLLTQEEAVRRQPGRLLRLVGQIPPEAAATKIDLLRRIQIAHPGDFWATYLLGTAAQQSFDFDEALRYLTAAAALRPRSPAAQYQLGIALRDKGRLDEAIERQREALRLDPGNSMCRRELGLALRLKGRLDEAVAELREAIRLNPMSHTAHFNLGATLESHGRPLEAVAAVREAVRIRPGYAIYHGGLGMMLFRQSKFAEAEAELREAARLHPELPVYRFDLINVLTAQGKTDEAIIVSRAALNLKAEDPYAHSDLARLFLCCPDPKLRDFRKAIEHAKKSIAMLPESAIAWQTLGWAQFRMGAFRESIESLEKSCALKKGGKGDVGQWIVLALAHAKIAAGKELSSEEREYHEQEFRRRYEPASQRILAKWSSRPTGMTQRAIWDFREEAAEWRKGKETGVLGWGISQTKSCE